MREEVKDFKRKDLFDYFSSKDNPFSIITTKIDITNIYNLRKEQGNYYGSIAYFFTKAMNRVPEFRYYSENGLIYKYDVLNPSFAEVVEDGNVGFFTCPFDDDYSKFMETYKIIKEKFKNNELAEESDHGGVVWVSCVPWFNFSSCVPPIDKNVTIPQLIWDKFKFEDGRCYVNLMIMAHHGFIDGVHIGKYISEIEKVIGEIEK